jgi:hypothetical protein
MIDLNVQKCGGGAWIAWFGDIKDHRVSAMVGIGGCHDSAVGALVLRYFEMGQDQPNFANVREW